VYYADKIINGGGAILSGVKYERITPEGLEISTSNGNREMLLGDTVVIATGAKVNSKEIELLQNIVSESYTIGDCADPQTILEAMESGFRAGQTV
jgi:hypothetical protein